MRLPSARFWRLVKKDEDDAALEKDLRATMAGKEPDVQIGLQIKLVSSPWFRGLLRL